VKRVAQNGFSPGIANAADLSVALKDGSMRRGCYVTAHRPDRLWNRTGAKGRKRKLEKSSATEVRVRPHSSALCRSLALSRTFARLALASCWLRQMVRPSGSRSNASNGTPSSAGGCWMRSVGFAGYWPGRLGRKANELWFFACVGARQHAGLRGCPVGDGWWPTPALLPRQ
jgi:hypothetical protein